VYFVSTQQKDFTDRAHGLASNETVFSFNIKSAGDPLLTKTTYEQRTTKNIDIQCLLTFVNWNVPARLPEFAFCAERVRIQAPDSKRLGP
jgi:hypothetical protein